MAQSRHLDPLNQCSLLGVKQTSRKSQKMSAYDIRKSRNWTWCNAQSCFYVTGLRYARRSHRGS